MCGKREHKKGAVKVPSKSSRGKYKKWKNKKKIKMKKFFFIKKV